MIDKLEYLIMLAHERHFGRAAERLGITQPTLSAGLRQLEERLGVTLVNRGSRFQGMTAEGERVLSWARRITEDMRAMREEIRTVRTGLFGHLRIGAIPTALAVVAKLAAAFRERHRGVTFEVVSHSAAELAAGIENFEIDLALTYLQDERLKRFDTAPLYEERYCLVTTRGGPLAGRRSLSWSEVAAQPLCLLDGTMHNRQIVNRHLGAEGASPEIVMESNSVIALLSTVRASPNLATVMPFPASAVLGLAEPMLAIPITEPDAAYSVGLVAARRAPRPPVVQAFWEECPAIPLH